MNYRNSFILIICSTIASCSTVIHLPQDELLYVGTRSVEVANSTQAPLQDQAIGEAKVAFVSPPNNALFGSSRYRSPFPLGLWAYNAFVNDSTGLKHWLFKTFAAQPILVSMVNPSLRANVAENTLRNYGYFDSHVDYDVDTLRDGRRARLLYTIDLGAPWRYGMITYSGFHPEMTELIHATWTERLLREGDQVSYNTLSGERNRLFNLFREHGYYYFRPEMITLFADTISTKGEMPVQITLQESLPPYAIKPWHVGNTHLSVLRNASEQPTDTTDTPSFTYSYKGKRAPIRQALLASRLDYNYGDLYSSSTQNTTLRNLNRLGVFNAVSISYIPHGDINTADTLDIYIKALLEAPYEIALESNITAKSNEQIGPGFAASLSRKNLFRLAETLQFRLKGSYEWQTNRTLRREGSIMNSFELGAETSLSVPQLLFPGGYNHRYHRPVSTSANIYIDWLNRGGFFRMLAFGTNLTYAFSTSDATTHIISPVKISFNTLEHTTERFDSLMTANAAIGLSFRDQFIPASSYTLTYDNRVYGRHHPSKVTLSFISAGAATSLLYAATGKSLNERGKSLLGTPFAQFIKGNVEACRYYHLTSKQTLATRFIIGAIYAYGNSIVPPFSEQFYIGGANDLRAFSLRSIGPGSFHSTGRYAYIDHTGDFKLEGNIEWRFPLLRQFSGALFIDAGNVWLLRADASRPGSQFKWSTFGKDIALGTGLGIRYNLKMVLLRCDIGIPLHMPYATTRHGYYNIPNFGQTLCFHFGVGYPF